MEARQHTALGGLAAETEPELDQFMKAYHKVLVKRSVWTSKAMTTTAAENRGAQMQWGAENSKAKGCSGWKECESVTTTRGVNPFSRKALPLAPRDAVGNLARRALRQPSL
jgi:hypothetical protein